MSISPEPLDAGLLSILRCPQSGKPLREASGEEVDRLNARIEAGELSDAAGETIRQRVGAALIAEGGGWLYPVRDSIPTLIPEEAIAWPQ